MKSKPIRYTVIVSAIVLFSGVAVAFAHGGRWGGGYGPHSGMMGYGHGPGMMGYYDDDDGYGPALTDEQRDQLQAAHDKFYADTEKLRDQIREQRYAIGNEMAKDTPDEAKVLSLQKELSKLQSNFDQIAVQHRLEVSKILPERARTQGRGYGRGNGMGYGGGYCWR